MAVHFTDDQVTELRSTIIPEYLANVGIAMIAPQFVRMACGKRNLDGTHKVDGDGNPLLYEAGYLFGDDMAFNDNGTMQQLAFVQPAEFSSSVLVIGNFEYRGRITH